MTDRPAESLPWLLEYRRESESLSIPHGWLTCNHIIEGFAKYREFYNVLPRYSFDEAVKYIGPSFGSDTAYVDTYFNENLGIRLWHPLAGALLDVALAAFADPWLCPEKSVLVWEDIHPSMVLDHAIQRLKATQPVFPKQPEEVYQLALNMSGVGDRFAATFDWMRSVSKPPLAPIVGQFGDSSDFLARVSDLSRQYAAYTFFEAHSLRRAHPSLFWLKTADPEVYRRFASITRPPIIIQPDILFFPWGEGRDESLGPLLAASSLCPLALWEFAHEVSIDGVRDFARRLVKTQTVTDDSFSVESLLRAFLPSPLLKLETKWG